MVMCLVLISDCDGVRLDKFLSQEISKTRSFIQNMISSGLVFVNGKAEKVSYTVKNGDKIEYTLPEIKVLDARPQDIPIDVVYEDEDVLVVNKRAGMVVHPAPGNPDNTLVNAVMKHCEGNLSGINSVIRPGIVHRIDKDTSGLLVVAKNDEAHLNLSEQFKVHSITRVYTAIVNGRFKENSGTIDAPIGRHPVYRKKMAVTEKNSKNAVTHFEVIEECLKYSIVKCRLETGRTHQIRVHMAYIGHPLLGDLVYGDKNKLGLKGQMLHAGVLGFNHPKSGEYMQFEAELPDEFLSVLDKLKKSAL
ncbi:MAG: RluA family pseudouridine synthase [Clostridia bacterium]|nr:RluA family pseudouridine synthase [Clostridia bacterium]